MCKNVLFSFSFFFFYRVFFIRKFGLTPAEANTVNSIVYTISAVSSPLFGILVDKFGRNIICCFVSILVTIGSHALLAFSFVNPFVGTVSNHQIFISVVTIV